jgi:hypothetical protein
MRTVQTESDKQTVKPWLPQPWNMLIGQDRPRGGGFGHFLETCSSLTGDSWFCLSTDFLVVIQLPVQSMPYVFFADVHNAPGAL